jgi:hypothetical protein
VINANETRSEKALIQFGFKMIKYLAVMAVLALVLLPISAQQNPTLTGDYAGNLGPLHLKLHLKDNGAGKVTGTLDNPDRGAIGIRCADFHVDGQSVSFSVPAVQGTWKGTVATDGALNGIWDQGRSLTLNFVRNTSLQAEKAF